MNSNNHLQNLIIVFLLIVLAASFFVGTGIGGNSDTSICGSAIMVFGAVGVLLYAMRPKRKEKAE